MSIIATQQAAASYI